MSRFMIISSLISRTGETSAMGRNSPSTRALSKHLEVSRSTVELAYEQLLSEGYIESAPYRGFFVAQIDELYQLKKEEKAGT